MTPSASFEWRAQHQVPLVASLHAPAMLSDFWIELFEAVGATLEEAHAADYDALIDDLLNGKEPASTDARPS